MHLIADRSRCIGAGSCALRLPKVFDQDSDEGLVQLLDDTGGGHTYDELSAAQYECPSQAISIVADENERASS
ncbi:ferredoxin [Streptomyces sp. NPDC001982]|uniref:ferredoxin n=1 Tax=unclassified Streptomyces TaxID=2593676 RepID=UPI00332019AF